jgi:Kef-type K+ transport system membrane component KefB
MLHLPTLILQVSVIIITARVTGWVFRKIHQPQVMGEMVAGILLGPSLLGWLAPGVSAALFPVESLGFLNALSQMGLLLFMFLIGLELQPQMLRNQGHTALVTSHASILAPFLLGSALALYLYPRLSDDSVTFMNFALFMGVAMSITAFPVLARILTERKLLNTKVGAMAIACAAVDDVTGWCLLAGIVLLVRSTSAAMPIWLTLGGTAVYVLVMLFLVRRVITPQIQQFAERRGGITHGALGIVLVFLFASAWITETLGIHALFGAFLVGVIMPKEDSFVQALTEKLHDLTVVLLLPLFFAYTGLRTSIGLVSGLEMWFFCGLIIAVAIAGKLGGSAVAARLSGMGPRQSWTIGILMNTRGLMELVLLNIGLDIGVISPTLFTMMVMMALITTFMTAPLLELVYFRQFSVRAWLRDNLAALLKLKAPPLESEPPEVDEVSSAPAHPAHADTSPEHG